MLKKISHVTILVKDQDDALAFYQGKLGFKIHTDVNFGDIRWLTLHAPDQPDVELSLMQVNSSEEDLVGRQAGSYPLLAFETDNCLDNYIKLKDLGVQFEGEPKEEDWGIGVTCKDLYGNLLYLVQSK